MSTIRQNNAKVFMKCFVLLAMYTATKPCENQFSLLPEEIIPKIVSSTPETIVPLYMTCTDLHKKIGLWGNKLDKKSALELIIKACCSGLNHTLCFVLIKNPCITSPDVGAVLIDVWRKPDISDTSKCRKTIDKIYPHAPGDAFFYAHDYICIISGTLCRADGPVYPHASYAAQN